MNLDAGFDAAAVRQTEVDEDHIERIQAKALKALGKRLSGFDEKLGCAVRTSSRPI
ncbi:MAG: hypothetical protein O2820_17915 [Planctomycetota bacterium]|nr:hypothetical protein [Planctomycetota bacterium]MDA1251096.1 hypothetical protein [Planctomycetota bacterium]